METKNAQGAGANLEGENFEKEQGKGAQEEQTKDQEKKVFSEDYVKQLREENAKWRTKLRELEEKLTTLGEVDPEEYKKLKEQQAELERKKLEEKGEFQKLKEQLINEHKRELEAKETYIKQLLNEKQSLDDTLNTTILSNSVAIEAGKAKAYNPKIVEMIIAQEAKVELTEDGKRVIRFYDSNGVLRVNGKTGDPLTVKERIAEMKASEEFAYLFEGGNVGAGSTTTFNGRKIDLNKLSASDRIRVKREMAGLS
jgi:hypothetical protein